MNDQNKNQKEIFITLAEATKHCSYSQEYLSLRARQGKLKSVKIGRNWKTKKEWVEEYERQNLSEEVLENNIERVEEFISLSEAVKFSSYSQEYLSLRARQGKLKAKKIDGTWFTKKSYLKEYEEKNNETNFQIQYGDISLNKKPNLSDKLLAEFKIFNGEKFTEGFYNVVDIFKNFSLSAFAFLKLNLKRDSNLKSSNFKLQRTYSLNQLIRSANFLVVTFLLILTTRIFVPVAFGVYRENQNRIEKILSLSSEKFFNVHKFQISNIKNKLSDFGNFFASEYKKIPGEFQTAYNQILYRADSIKLFAKSQLNDFNFLNYNKDNYAELKNSISYIFSSFDLARIANERENYYIKNNSNNKVLGTSELVSNISSNQSFTKKIINYFISLNKYRDYPDILSEELADKFISTNLVLWDNIIDFIKDVSTPENLRFVYLGGTDKPQPQIIQNYYTVNGDTQVIQKTILIKGEKGDKGDKGDAGEKGDVGEKGEKGEDGSFIGGFFVGGGTTIVHNGASLSDNNTWTGLNTFVGLVNLSSDLSSSADVIVTGNSSFATTTATGLTLSDNGLTISSSTPVATADTLYNLGGDLYWNGSVVGSGTLPDGNLDGDVLYWSGSSWTSTGTLSISDTKISLVGDLEVSGNSSITGNLNISGVSTLATTTVLGLTSTNNGLTLASSTPISTTNTLYNIGGLLYWNGSAIGMGGAASSTYWDQAFAHIALDADTNASNEIQTLGTDGNQITLSLGGGSVTAPYATTAGTLSSLLISQFTNDSGYLTTTTGRQIFSSTSTSLVYDPLTGQFAVAEDYNIPLTASTTNWNNVYDLVVASSTSWGNAANLVAASSTYWDQAFAHIALDADTNASNEIQTLGTDGNQITLSLGG
ncbi:MAG: hypothetical protein PHD05_07420, partial [Sphaerochaetaceae bacterium]|nr:hypothetical protein [Sphaerochaetaceae bacterium]